MNETMREAEAPPIDDLDEPDRFVLFDEWSPPTAVAAFDSPMQPE